ncbi:MAG: CoA transferase, partial [Alcaligenaceae bacterium]
QWHVQVSLAQTGQWLRSLGRVADGLSAHAPDRAGYLESSDSGFGALQAVRHSAQLSRTPAGWSWPSVPPGTHLPHWP